MAMGHKRTIMCCTLLMTIAATCGIIIYIKISADSKKVSSEQSLENYFLNPEKHSEEQCISVCDTKECLYQSKRILDNMKPDVNPCDDFYELACGGIFEKFGQEENHDYAKEYENLLFTKVKNILDNIEADPTSASGKMKAVYDSCMEYSSSDLKSVSTALKFLDSFGIPNWPNLASDFKFDNYSLSKVIANFLLYKEYAFFDFSAEFVFLDIYDGTRGNKENTTLLSTKSRYEKLNKPERKYLVNHILNYFSVDPETINNIWEESEAIHEAIATLKEESRVAYETKKSTTVLLNCTENKIKDFSVPFDIDKLFKEIDANEIYEDIEKEFCDILESLVENAGTSNETNKDFAVIREEDFYFVQNIFLVIRSFTDRSIANYLSLNFILNNLDDLSTYFYLLRKRQKVDKWSYEVQSPYERKRSFQKSKRCVEWIIRHMAFALGHEYLKNDLTLPMLHEVQDLGNECFREAENLIFRQEWINNDVKELMKEEIEYYSVDFETLIGNLFNETDVNEIYEDLEFRPTDEDFFHNALEYKKCEKIAELRSIVYLGYVQLTLRDIFVPNANSGAGNIGLNLGILLPPTYVPGAQRIMNLVSLGSIISHEMAHNLQRSLPNSMQKSDPKAYEYFKEKRQCLVDQYSQFRIESIGKNVNGTQTNVEDLADAMGMSVLDKLIEKYANNDSVNSLPFLSFSLKQQLYIYGAQQWCAAHTKENDELSYIFDTHSPQRFRILGMLQNSKGFSEAFGCPSGSYMNPITKCSHLE